MKLKGTQETVRIIPLIMLHASQSIIREVCLTCSPGFQKWGHWKTAQESKECGGSDGDQEARGAVTEPGCFAREAKGVQSHCFQVYFVLLVIRNQRLDPQANRGEARRNEL